MGNTGNKYLFAMGAQLCVGLASGSALYGLAVFFALCALSDNVWKK